MSVPANRETLGRARPFAALSPKQLNALDLMRRARHFEPSTDDGLLYGQETFYDREIHVAYVNAQTARALQRKGLVTLGPYDPDWGTSLTLTEDAL